MSKHRNLTSSEWNTMTNASAMAGQLRTGNLSTYSINPTMNRVVTPMGSTGSASVSFGRILRVGAGTYDCMVLIGNRMIGCSFASTMVSHTFGYSFAALPVEGSSAVVVLPEYDETHGIVIAIFPFGNWVSDDTPIQMKSQELDPYSPHGYTTVSAYKTPIEDPDYEFKLNSSSNRPMDVIPGEFAVLNEHRAGLRFGTFSAEIRGGGAFVRAERLDDEIRIGSLAFTMWTALDCFRSFNDQGIISGESKECSFQGERLGFRGLFLPSEDSAGGESHPRVKEFRGYLGSQRNTFVLRPETPEEPEEGVATSHVSQSGKILTRSASGISLELYDRIPIPKRVKEYWDPQEKGKIELHPKSPFDFGDNPHTVAMKAYDSIAWNQRNDYMSFDNYGDDFSVPQEDEIPSPGDPDRDPQGSMDSLRKNNHRRAGLHIMPDGSVIIRDAWGSELVLSGGNVYINTCGSVISTAHRDTVFMSGKGVVMKAREGAVTADSAEGVVEIHGKRHVTIVGGADGQSEGGVLIEALGTSNGTRSDEKLGLYSAVNGVVIKAMQSDVAVEGKNIKALGEKDIKIATGEDGTERKGTIVLASESLRASVQNNVAVTAPESILYVGKSGIQAMSSGSIHLWSKSGFTMVQNKKYLGVPQWVPVDDIDDVLDRILDVYDEVNDLFQDSKSMAPYDWKSFKEKILAVMGRSEDYNTISGTEPYFTSSKFTMYQPSWQWLRDKYPELITIVPTNWDMGEYTVNKSVSWPGKRALEEGKFVVLNDNPNLNGEGYSKKRPVLKDNCPTDERPISDFML